MNFNVITYSIYLPIMIFVTVYVGYVLFKNGRAFILKQFNGDQELTDNVNRILLAGYYLLNLGFCLYIITTWENINSWTELFGSLSETIGQLIVGLGVIHFVNIGTLLFMGKLKSKKGDYPQLIIN